MGNEGISITKMLFYFVVLIVCISAQQRARKPCCWDPQFEEFIATYGENVNSQTGYAEEEEGKFWYHYDYMHRRTATIYSLSREAEPGAAGKVIVEYNKNKLYRISLNGTVCNVSDFFLPMDKPCIPENATFMGSAYLGYGYDKLEFDSWHYDVAGSDWDVHLDVASENCIPLLQTMRGHIRGNETERVVEFREYRDGIRDTSVFDIPPICTAL